MMKDAVISDDNVFRYRLSRTWNPSLPKVLFIMLNPSTADDNNDDNTIRNVISMARANGYGGILVGNLYAYRATSPTVLHRAGSPIGPENINHVSQMIREADAVVYAWGLGKPEPNWLRQLVNSPKAICLLKSGCPGHPLYKKNNSRFCSVIRNQNCAGYFKRQSPPRQSPPRQSPPRQPNCNLDEEINPRTGRCRKKCRPEQIRNPATGRCVKRSGPIGRRILRNVQSPPGQPNCNLDEEINPRTGRCRKKCRPEQIRNPATGRCVKRSGPIGRRILRNI